MVQVANLQHDVRAYWNSRAGLGKWAGTQDIIAKQLEIEAIAEHVKNGMRVLELGCGNGVTAIELARRFDISLVGIDFAEEMVAAARQLATGQLVRGSLNFELRSLEELSGFSQPFDLIYTERVLINLPDWPAQSKAIASIGALLVPDGMYVMCENSQDGLDGINLLRKRIGLPKIVPPWHNHYFRDVELEQASFPGLILERINYYSSTYYFLSRVVNAVLAAKEGREPEYEAPVNQLALKLPSIGNLGQGRIWLWRKSRD
jgi:ubiquinone/menaquinone biosynthesis C-methylase UbiE